MIVKDLINALIKEDPTQELEVCVGNRPIHFVENTHAYYDGPLQVLIQQKENPYYNVIGAKFVRSGNKVQIHILSIEDAILNDPDLPVECQTDKDKELVDRWKKEAKEVRERVEKMFPLKPPLTPENNAPENSS